MDKQKATRRSTEKSRAAHVRRRIRQPLVVPQLLPPRRSVEARRSWVPGGGAQDPAGGGVKSVTVPTLEQVAEVLKREYHAEFQLESVRALGGPIVYAWVRGDQVLYVGFGGHGFARPLQRTHHRLFAMEPGDRVVVWCFDTEEQAAEAERQLIRLLHPPMNGPRVLGERKPRRTPRVDEEPEAKRMAPEEVWTDVKETAALLHRSPKTIRNLVSKHELSRRIVRRGRARRRIMLISFRTRERLRALCWGPEPS